MEHLMIIHKPTKLLLAIASFSHLATEYGNGPNYQSHDSRGYKHYYNTLVKTDRLSTFGDDYSYSYLAKLAT